MRAYVYEIAGAYIVIAAPNSVVAWKIARKAHPGGSPQLKAHSDINEDGTILCQITTNKRGIISCESGGGTESTNTSP